jgi:glycosyltransferase involved in cell wall biosynthesis
MRIAINTRFLLSSKMEGFGWFTYEVISRIVSEHPEHEFIFFFDRAFDEKFIFAGNVKGVVLNPPARHPILFKIWFNYSVTKALKKYKIDLFFSPDGYLSLKTKVKQIGVIHDLNFEHFPEDLPRAPLNYLKKYFPLFAKKANHILTVSQYSKDDICKTYGIDKSKVTVSYNGASDLFRPILADNQQLIRKKYAEGIEYFVFVGALHARKNVARLFEAYEQFKNETKSTTKLVIVGEKLWSSVDLEKSYGKLTHKGDVIFTGHLPINRNCRQC